MSTLDELQRSVERLNRAVERLTRAATGAPRPGIRAFVEEVDLALLLSERAELLATVEKLVGALQEAREYVASALKEAEFEADPDSIAGVKADLTAINEALAALTTGEEK